MPVGLREDGWIDWKSWEPLVEPSGIEPLTS